MRTLIDIQCKTIFDSQSYQPDIFSLITHNFQFFATRLGHFMLFAFYLYDTILI